MANQNVSLAWLADAPLFIDAPRVSAFYDAVVRPEGEQGKITLELSDETVNKFSGEASIEGQANISQWITKMFPFLEASMKVGGKAATGHEVKDGEKRTIELHSISTPQRQLVQLALHYASQQPDRLFFISGESVKETHWRSSETIRKTPRGLVFLDLPSLEEAERMPGIPETRLIPTAAELDNGRVVPIYLSLKGEKEEELPKYPQKAPNLETLREERKAYWRWFDQNFSATSAMQAVEAAAEKGVKLSWIDYRLPITTEGDTLHLHISPSGVYDTGVFAYNFIKRGQKHGLRIVGTLKSEPDINVLAIFEK